MALQLSAMLTWPPLWRHSRHFSNQIITFTELIVADERGPLSLVSTTEELLDRKVEAPV
jgi:hypothetical protein